jgi:hypothetical protein
MTLDYNGGNEVQQLEREMAELKQANQSMRTAMAKR